MNTFNENINNLEYNEEFIKTTYSENNEIFENRFNKEFNNRVKSFQNNDLIGLKYFPDKKDQIKYENMPPKEDAKNDDINIYTKTKDLSYYNQIIFSLNKELDLIDNNLMNKNKNKHNNIPIRSNSTNKKGKNKNNKQISLKENKFGNGDKLKELENNKQILIDKNKEIEDQINNLQNLAQKVNLINEKNIYNNSNIYKEDEQQYININPQSQNEINHNSSLINNNKVDKEFNSYFLNPNININPEKYQNANNNDNFIQKDEKNLYNHKNIYINEDINNYYDINNNEKINRNNLGNHLEEENISNSKFITRNKLQNNTLNNINKKHKSFNRKKSQENLKIKANKNNKNNSIVINNNNETSKKIIKRINTQKNNGICLSAKNNKIKNNKKIGGCFERNLSQKLINEFNNIENRNNEDKYNLIKNIILEMNNQNFNDNTKMFLIDKINELQNDYNNKISSIEKKHKNEIEKKNKKILKLEKENNELKKKVTKIKSIV